MSDLNALKKQLKEQNQRLLEVTQEKSRIESKNKVNQQRCEDGRGKCLDSIIFSLVDCHLISAFPFPVLPEIEPYEIRNRFSFLVSLSAHCVQSLVPEGTKIEQKYGLAFS